jgi:hypothetical protein
MDVCKIHLELSAKEMVPEIVPPSTVLIVGSAWDKIVQIANVQKLNFFSRSNYPDL